MHEAFPTDGDRVIRFIETFCSLGGSFIGQPYKVMPYQREVIRDIYRLDPVTGKRVHRTYLLGLPRKQAKSILGAALAVYQLIVDDADASPQIISAAGDRAQAKLVFSEAKRIIQSSPDLNAICTIHRDQIINNRNGGVYKVVSADAGASHGLNPSFVIVDELHVHKNEDLLVALNSGSAMRNEPLTLIISTAGYDKENSPLGRLYQKGRRIESGEEVDPSFGWKWFGPRDDEDVDASDPEVWKRFNPAWDICNQAEFKSAYSTMPESEFRRFRLNQWTATAESWLPTGAWASREDTTKPIKSDDEVILGFDGSWRGDSTALVAIRLEDLHIELIGLWEAQPGDQHFRVPAQEVADSIRNACRNYRVKEIAADPSRWEAILQDLEEEGLPIVESPNTVARMVPATQAFYESVMDGSLTHDGNPAMARHISNCVLKMDSKGARITKEYKSSAKHIDIAVAAVMAQHRAKLYRESVKPEPMLLVI